MHRAAGDLLRFVRFAHEAIMYRALPVSRILTEYAAESDGFSDFYLSGAESSLSDVLRKRSDIDSATRAVMLEFAGELGRGLTDAELALCKSAERRLSEHYEALGVEAKQKSSVFSAASTFVSVTLILLLF